MINRDPTEWERLIENARPVVIHVMETLAADQDLDDPKVKTGIASQVMVLIEDLPSPIERDTYRQRLARLLRVDERSLVSTSRARPTRRHTYRRQPDSIEAEPIKKSVSNSSASINRREIHILGILLRNPDLIYHIDRKLKEDGLHPLGEGDFEQTDHQVLFTLIKDSLDQNDVEPLDHALNHLPDPMMNPADAILEQTNNFNSNGRDILKDVLLALLMLREHQLSQQLDHLRYMMETAQEEGDLKAIEYQSTMMHYVTLRGRLHKARSRYTNQDLTNS